MARFAEHSQGNKLPAHLAGYVVEQDYEQYDAADQQTWRFVMKHLYDHLKHAAHPSYIEGLPGTGLSIERIPQVSDIDAAMGQVGWRAACITGFIPPRAFQSFQAHGILPIAADIRNPLHLAYTPAPDIIHEAAGHAPILINRQYGDYLRAIGSVSQTAFSSKEDLDLYRAITRLSQVKELPAPTEEMLEDAHTKLEQARQAQVDVSESARLARLYWWTAEYGLIGTVTNYRLYGAGLLSSLGEAVFCQDETVQKLVLSTDCLDFAYDITRPQPQLFVCTSFEHLMEVLEECQKQLSYAHGLEAAALGAIRSRLLSRLTFADNSSFSTLVQDAWITGQINALKLCGMHGVTAPNTERTLVGESIEALSAHKQDQSNAKTPAKGRWVPLYPVSQDRRVLATAWRSQLKSSTRVQIQFASGARVAGSLLGFELDATGQVTLAHFSEAVVTVKDQSERYDGYCLPMGAELREVRPADAELHQVQPTLKSAPAPRTFDAQQTAVRELYRRALALDTSGHTLEEIHTALNNNHPDEWLLRWRLLEHALIIGRNDKASALYRELDELEKTYDYRQPIATGLEALRLAYGNVPDSVPPSS